MATGKQIFKEADELVKEHGLAKATEIIKDNIKYGKNSVTVALWEATLDVINSNTK